MACGAPHELTLARFRAARRAGSADATLRLAARFGLAPELGRFCSGLPPGDIDSVVRIAVAEGLAAKARSLACLRLLARVVATPACAASSPIAFKGAALALAGYYAWGERYMTDADLLVPRQSLGDWEAAVRDRGLGWLRRPSDHYEGAIVSDGATRLEVHVALPGKGGRSRGPSYEQVLPHTVPPDPRTGIEGVRTPDASVSREIAVDHFVFHHGGDPFWALRTLQDLIRLESGPEGPGLPWDPPSPTRAAGRLRRIARAARAGQEDEDDEAREFFAAVSGLVESADAGRSFADDVDLWLHSERASGGHRLALLGRRLFPPLEEVRRSADEAAVVTAASYLSRAARMSVRYLGGAISRLAHPRRTRTQRTWREYLERLSIGARAGRDEG